MIEMPFEWQAPIIINECHTKHGCHQRIQPTCNIIKSEYKWDSMYQNVRRFVNKSHACQISSNKIRKDTITHHIKAANLWKKDKSI